MTIKEFLYKELLCNKRTMMDAVMESHDYRYGYVIRDFLDKYKKHPYWYVKKKVIK